MKIDFVNQDLYYLYQSNVTCTYHVLKDLSNSCKYTNLLDVSLFQCLFNFQKNWLLTLVFKMSRRNIKFKKSKNSIFVYRF